MAILNRLVACAARLVPRMMNVRQRTEQIAPWPLVEVNGG
jgi:hypothetical protein